MPRADGTATEPLPRSRRWRRPALAGAVIVAVCGHFGCTSVVTAPPSPADPTRVFVLREAMHVGVVLPDGTPPQRYLEFGFGDWGYYALGHDAWYDVFATVLWSTQGGLSRREFFADSPERLRAVASWVELDELVVPGAAVQKLRERLERTFASRQAQRVVRGDLRMSFVPADQGYWFLRTCADVAAGWLEELGCSVSWVPIRASLVAGK
ncbi:MAG TPA: DUF2459 domain-containing protein [Planctomycetota bacterium]|nr:DUF2459 domain-containing protein [Planctomycetota bacterium]